MDVTLHYGLKHQGPRLQELTSESGVVGEAVREASDEELERAGLTGTLTSSEFASSVSSLLICRGERTLNRLWEAGEALSPTFLNLGAQDPLAICEQAFCPYELLRT